jgi:hypothetical protein
MFGSHRIHHQGVDSLYWTEITYGGSHVPVMCVIGVWQHIVDLWCVCVCACTASG